MEDSVDKIKKEEIEKSNQPQDSNHPNEEISSENKIIIGDIIEGEEPSPVGNVPGKRNYVLIILLIVVVVIAVFWGIKGCRNQSIDDVQRLSSLLIQPK